jgi:23S rRNA (adenine2503-C2)-methyltransferase
VWRRARIKRLENEISNRQSKLIRDLDPRCRNLSLPVAQGPPSLVVGALLAGFCCFLGFVWGQSLMLDATDTGSNTAGDGVARLTSATGTGYQSIYGLSRGDCLNLLGCDGASSIKNAFRVLYRDIAFAEMPVIPRRLRKVLGDDRDGLPELVIEHSIQSPEDGSFKLIFRVPLTDFRIESVLMPERGRLTLCVSSQVGCAQGCHFCQTGKMGLLRQLSTAEIVAQVVLANRHWSLANATGDSPVAVPSGFGAPRVTNVVFMGMGEPLDNLDAVLKACEILSDPWGLGIGISKITVSTVGLPVQMTRLLQQSKVQLALSLHSPFDEQRSRMMPINRRYPIAELLTVLRTHLRKGSHAFIQYTLIRNVNDSLEHAAALGELLREVPCKINLIPLNEHDGAAFRRPSLETIVGFSQVLRSMGFVVTVRLSKGRGIDAACGQLVKKVSRDLGNSNRMPIS